jgi:hypothetical protein
VRGRGCGARGRTCNPLPGGFGHQPLGTMTGVRGARWTQGQAGVGNAHSTDRPRPRKPGLKLRPRRRKSLWRKPRWNADSRAPRVTRRGRARKARHNPIASVGVSPPNVFLGLAKTKRQAPPLIFFFAASFVHCEWRIASGLFPFATHHSLFALSHSSGAKERRENGIPLPPPGGERSRANGLGRELPPPRRLPRRGMEHVQPDALNSGPYRTKGGAPWIWR